MTQLPFNPRTMTAKKALAALSEHPDLTVAELADLLAEEGRHTNPRSSVRKELNARIEAAAPLDDEPEDETVPPEEDLADEPDEKDDRKEEWPCNGEGRHDLVPSAHVAVKAKSLQPRFRGQRFKALIRPRVRATVKHPLKIKRRR